LKLKKPKIVVFADLDGTVLDENYGFQNLKPIISEILAVDASIVFCSSKTRREIEFYRKELCVTEPFIAENGAAVYIPRGYFQFSHTFTRNVARYCIIELGIPYSLLRRKLAKVKLMTATNLVGFGDMTVCEITENTGLPLQLARYSLDREYDEPFRILDGDEKEILRAIEQEGLSCTRGGRYFHLIGYCDKGKAVTVLKGLYSRKFGRTITFGVGDGPNDMPMLKAVDAPFLIGKTANKYAVWKEILNLAYETSC
jgi:mannosyl-3-phosphoglycerate phosphatase